MGTEKYTKTEPLTEHKLSVWVENRQFDNWKNVSVSLDMDSATSTFSFSVGPLEQSQMDWVDYLEPGKLVEIKRSKDVGEMETILRGIIDTQSIKSSGTDESLEISGRDVVGLLVDSSIGVSFKVKKKNLKEVAEQIIKPFTVEASNASGYTHILKMGSRGEEVLKAQTKLKDLKLYKGNLDNIFGPLTRQAVIDFQRDKNLKVDGIIGPETGPALGLDAGRDTDENELFAFHKDVKVDCIDYPGEGKSDKFKSAVEKDTYDKKPKGPGPADKCESYLRQLVEGKDVEMWLDQTIGQLVIGHRDYERKRKAEDEDNPTRVLNLFTFRDEAKAQYNNFKDTQTNHTIQSRFSEYKFFGKQFGGQSNQSKCCTEYDDTVGVYKPSYTKIEKVDDVLEFDRKAKAAVNKGKSARFQITGTAVGYGQRVDGKPHYYDLNTMVDVVHTVSNVRDRFYISKVTYSCDASSGPQSSLTLRLLDPEQKPKKENINKGS